MEENNLDIKLKVTESIIKEDEFDKLNKESSLINNGTNSEKNYEQEGNEIKIDLPKDAILPNNFKPFVNDPYLGSNCLSKILMYWPYKILKLASKTKMRKEYLGEIGDAHDSKHFNDEISEIWDKKNYKSLKKYGLIISVFLANIKNISILFFLTLIKATADYFSIILIKIFINTFDESLPKNNFIYKLPVWVLAIFFLSSQIIGSFLDIQINLIQDIFGNRAQFQLSTFIYHKLLRCSPSSFIQRASEGEIINFIQTDADKFNWMLIRSPTLLLHPIQIIAYSYLVFDFF